MLLSVDQSTSFKKAFCIVRGQPETPCRQFCSARQASRVDSCHLILRYLQCSKKYFLAFNQYEFVVTAHLSR